MEIKNAIYYPNNFCIYNENGDIIPESCVIRSNGIIHNPPKKVKIPDNYIKGTKVYGGKIPNSFGHFLTEGASRLWYPKKGTNLLIHNPGNIPSFISRLLSYNGLSFHKINKPTVIEKLIIPESSFRNRLYCTDNHKIFFERVAKKVAGNSTLDKPLYLSRKKLSSDKRLILNEEKIENWIKEKGGDVIYPETLSIEQQICKINSYDTIIGCLGSAMHLLLFRVTPLKNIHILCVNDSFRTTPNYRFIDQIKKLNTKYHKVLNKDNNCKKLKHKKNLVADMEKIKCLLI